MKQLSENTCLVKALRAEADLCRNETADDIAELLDDAANQVERMREWIARDLQQREPFYGGAPLPWEKLDAEHQQKWLLLADENVRRLSRKS